MTGEWIVESEQHGTERFPTFETMMRRLLELYEVLPKTSLSVTLPDMATPSERSRVEDLGFRRPLG